MQRVHAAFHASQGSGWLALGLAICNRCASSSGSISCISTSAPCSRQGSSNPSSKAESLPLHLRDQILLKGMLFHGFHGACPEENVLGQKFLVDATLWADLAAAGCSDDLQDTIDYSKAYSTVKEVVEGPARQLQEAVVEELCGKLLQMDPRVTAVQVYLRKPHVPLPGVMESVGIQMFRARKAS